MTVTISSLTAVGSAPSSPDDVWGLAYAQEMDFAGGMNVTTRYKTLITEGSDLSEIRRGQMIRPARTISLPHKSMSKQEALAIQMQMFRFSQAGFLAPILPDKSELTSTTAAGNTTLNMDTTYRRFHEGARILALRSSDDYEVLTIDSKTNTTITVDTGPTADLNQGVWIFPLVECEMLVNSSAKFRSGHVARASYNAYEKEGPTALPPVNLSDPVSPPFYYGLFGFPILPLDWVDWDRGVRFSADRRDDKISSGITYVHQPRGSRASYSHRIPIKCMTRAEAWDVLGFFNSRSGREYDFWVPALMPEYEFLDMPLINKIRVTGHGQEYDWNYRPYISLKTIDPSESEVAAIGDTQVSQVTSVTRSSGIDTLTIDPPLQKIYTASEVERVGSARFCRFDMDSLVERWQNGNIMTTEFAIKEQIVRVTSSEISDPPGGDPIGDPPDPPVGANTTGFLIFIDEASPGYTDSESNWLADLALWDAAVAAYGLPSGFACIVPDNTGTSAADLVTYDGTNLPIGITLTKVVETPSEAQLTAAIDTLQDASPYGSVTLTDYVLHIDNSGSMSPATLEPGLAAWKSGKTVVQSTFGNEFWLARAAEAWEAANTP